MNAALVIMAAGMGSRYGGEKQTDGIGPHGEAIMEYSVYDAVRAGFRKIVFIIKPGMEAHIRTLCGDRIATMHTPQGEQVEVAYAVQDFTSVPGFYKIPAGRTKPFGTVHAALCARSAVQEPFAIINADDYYGKEGFKAVHDYLVNGGKSCMAGFVLKNTLSDNGGVTRGICKMDAENNLTEVVETKNIVKTADGAEADGKVIDVNSLVSIEYVGINS